MIARLMNPEERKDIAINLEVLKGDDHDSVVITIDQQKPPCADCKQTNYYILEVPAETDLDKRL